MIYIQTKSMELLSIHFRALLMFLIYFKSIIKIYLTNIYILAVLLKECKILDDIVIHL